MWPSSSWCQATGFQKTSCASGWACRARRCVRRCSACSRRAMSRCSSAAAGACCRSTLTSLSSSTTCAWCWRPQRRTACAPMASAWTRPCWTSWPPSGWCLRPSAAPTGCRWPWDEAFHCALVAAAGNAEVARVHRDVTERIRIIRRLDFTKQARIDATYDEHAKILKRRAAQARRPGRHAAARPHRNQPGRGAQDHAAPGAFGAAGRCRAEVAWYAGQPRMIRWAAVAPRTALKGMRWSKVTRRP
jgi:hypothetical protein